MTMNPDWLLKHFEQISEAPDAVPRLRRFILDLAVRGKLVEQNPKDEPASELLKKIEAEKDRLVKEGEIKKQEVFQTVADDELPFSIPSGWCAMRMGWLARKLGAGSTPLGGKSVYQNEGIPFLRSQNVHDDGLQLEDVALITRTIHDKMSGTHIQDQDILLNITGASIGRCALVPSGFRQGNVSQHVAIIRLFVPTIREFIHLSLISSSYQKLIMDVQVGVSREGLSMQRLRLFPMLIPPPAEQHRIVAKVDELMALCDELETAQAKRERRRDRLVAATLHGLGKDVSPKRPQSSSENGGFGETALPSFFLNHLPRLTTRPEHIQQLRQTILKLAVRGRLVPQDPSDEPATDLIRKIAVERLRLLQDKQIPVQKSVKPSEHFDNESKIPDTWQQCYLQDIAYQITDGTHLTPKYTDYGKPFLSAQNIKPFRFMPGYHRYVSERDFENYRSNRKPERGDILLTRVGAGIGEAAVLDADMEFAFYVSLCLIKIPTLLVSPEFLVIWLNSPTGRGNSATRTYGKDFSQGNLNLGLIRTFRVPLPPLGEQHRIVAKVDKLMALCDGLETKLTTTAFTRRQFLQATLAEAVSGYCELRQGQSHVCGRSDGS